MDRWQLRSQGGSAEEGGSAPLAGGFRLFSCGTPLGQKYDHPDDRSGPHRGRVPTPAHTLMHSLHAPLTPRLAPVLDLQVRQEGRSQDRRTAASRPGLSLPLLPCPELPPWLSHSLAHSFSPTQSACWPGPGSSLAGGNAWFERGLVQWRKDFFLLFSPRSPESPCPQCPCSESTWEAGRVAPPPPLPAPPGTVMLPSCSLSHFISSGHLTAQPSPDPRPEPGSWAVNRLPWVLSARKEELLGGFLKVASSYPLPVPQWALRCGHTRPWLDSERCMTCDLSFSKGHLSWTEGASGAQDCNTVI
ncbi:PREDICTED: uncharacterized protein LOC102251354 [Myotis brandtii]|uniref:uncharacterized protein LOC102251354 n=1 Tax=Myotis brandtii TaxID=109478 RepID=UPI0003BB70A5|nr:PREDICTED: uncharacterized protein LOC102251354 [Myotis brandtii]XP_014387119.1 PREDICTED: uncharacterized protein LOC102251354 [Myotis brandtii]XP_014387123.1 PREDICTED: uncharacterized protein LOC102251354 [Myotis brandtii]XP_014387127.1 PREDICTED: uncharacterized protein LOC102251354 [Myotis brandtii]XP_014387128.1 PREDICTED: uncharacterized protein LOC102251354 [Myotis brandtii]XP_014387129.1 PREDICTED: uncharacterized protein LOC102251354 [Myotis brandtii]